MNVFTKPGPEVFAGFDAAGVARRVDNAEAQVWSAEVEAVISAGLSAGSLIYDTQANLNADLAHDANSSAWVISDTTAANNGIYRKNGASGAGSWARIADLPYSFIRLVDAGAGTANAIQVTSTIPTSVSVMRVVKAFEANTGDVTIAENGAAAKSLLTASGNQISANGLVAGMMIVYVDDGAAFRLLTDQASAAIQAAAEAARDASETANTAAQAAAVNAASYDPTLRFPSMAALLTDTSRGAAGVGAIWQGGDLLMREADASASDNHTVKGGDVKLYAQPLQGGGLDARQLGSIGDNVSHPLSERYSTLAKAQAAFPLTTAFWASERPIALTDEIDWAACQEIALRGKLTTYKPMVRFGETGILTWNRQVRTLGNNNGITMGGPDWTVPHQGSTPTGVTVNYTGTPGTPEPALDMRSGFDRLVNLAFWNAGNGRTAFRATGATPGSSGAERIQIDNVFSTQAAGKNAWGTCHFEIYGAADYMKWGRLELSGLTPIGILLDGAGVTSGGTTRFRLEEILAGALGDVDFDLFKFTNGSAEHLSLGSVTMNFKNNSSNGSIVNTSELTGLQHVDILDVHIAEYDTGSATGGARRVGKLKNTNIAKFSASSWADFGTTDCLFEVDTGVLVLDAVLARSVGGPLVKVAHGYPTEKVITPTAVMLISSNGLVDTSYGNGKVPLTQASSVIIDGSNSNHRNTVYEITITSVGTTVNLGVRDFSSAPKGQFLPPEEMELHIKNTSGGTYSNFAFNSPFKMISGYTLTAIPASQTGIFKFRCEGSTWRQTQAQVNTTT